MRAFLIGITLLITTGFSFLALAEVKKVKNMPPQMVTYEKGWPHYSHPFVEKLIAKLKKSAGADKDTFQFQQKVLNFPLCSTRQMWAPLCILFLKDKKINFSLETDDQLNGYFNIYPQKLIKDTPTETIFEGKDVAGNSTYMKIAPISENSTCGVLFYYHTGGGPEIFNGEQTVSFDPLMAVSPSCYRYPILDRP